MNSSPAPEPERVGCQVAVLFVCLGNICRSPLAEAAFRREADRNGMPLKIDSAGTGNWHAGHQPDPRAISVAARHGIDIRAYRARQVRPDDFRIFSHIIALDRRNLSDLESLKPADSRAELSLLLDFVPGREGAAVVDPYYGDDAGFEVTWRDVVQGAEGLLRHIAAGMV